MELNNNVYERQFNDGQKRVKYM